MKSQIFPLIIAAMVISQPAFAGKKNKKANADAGQINICIPDSRTEFITFVAKEAEDMGYFKARGLNVNLKKLQRKGGGAFRENGVLNKQILDYGVGSNVALPETNCQFGGSTVERYLIENEMETKPLMVSYYGENYDTHLVVAKNSKIKSVKELKGGKLHVGQLPTRMAVERLLEANGVPVASVDLNGGLEGGAERLEGLESGEITAMTSYLPSMSYLLATDKVRVLSANVVSRYLSPRVPHGLLVVNEKYAQANPKQVEALVAAMNESYEYILRNPAEILNVLLRHKKPRGGDSWYNMTEAEVQKAANFIGKVKLLTVGKSAADDAQLNCDIRNFGKEIVKSKLIGETLDLAAWLGIPPESRTCPATEKTVASAEQTPATVF